MPIKVNAPNPFDMNPERWPYRNRIMSPHILFVYVEGADLEGVAEQLTGQFEEFIRSYRWIVSGAFVVNQRHGIETCTSPGDLPLWDLGLNVPLPDPGTEPPGWFTDIEAIAKFLGKLHRNCGRDFVIGIANTETGINEDLFNVTTDSPDLVMLRAIIGVST